MPRLEFPRKPASGNLPHPQFSDCTKSHALSRTLSHSLPLALTRARSRSLGCPCSGLHAATAFGDPWPIWPILGRVGSGTQGNTPPPRQECEARSIADVEAECATTPVYGPGMGEPLGRHRQEDLRSCTTSIVSCQTKLDWRTAGCKHAFALNQ